MKEIDFKDRVPTYPGRIKLIPVDGKENTYDIVRVDEPIEGGTPINKALFNSITQSRMTGRYYPLVIAEAVPSLQTFNVSPLQGQSWTVDMTGCIAVCGGWEVSATSCASAEQSVEKTVDGASNTHWSAQGELTEEILIIKLPFAICVKKVYGLLYGGTGTTGMYIQGSTDGAEWINLYSATGKPSGEIECILETTGDYQYYRLCFERGSSYLNNVSIYELSFSEWTTTAYELEFATENIPGQWEIGQRVMVQVPELPLEPVIGNTFSGIPCNTILKSLKRYELVYNGSSFDAREV